MPTDPLVDEEHAALHVRVVLTHAAQDPKNPGVLLLSRFAGAAEELRDAVVTNPWYATGTARDLDRALRMPEEAKLNPKEHLRLQTFLGRERSERPPESSSTW